MGALRSLRGRVALLATLAVAAVLLAVGAAAVASFSEREHDRVDDALAGRPLGGLARALGGEVRGPGPGPPGRGGRGGRGGPGLGPEALRPEGEYVRLVSDGQAVSEVDAPEGLAVPETAGFRTLSAGGRRYRSLTREIPGRGLLEVGRDLTPAEDRVDELRNRLVVLGAVGVALAGGLAWWLAGLALRPLGALRSAAGRVSTTRDLSTRIESDGSAAEIAELGGSINEMLGRLERSARETDAALEATRRFAGDAGHELRTPMTALRASLGALRRNPDLDPDERRQLLEAADHEAARAARLLETLQTLARGDAGAALPREQIELSGVVEAAVGAARARHPSITWEIAAPPDDIHVTGWPDGIRALLDNLLENAARHGRPAGVVTTTVGRDADAVVIRVDDDGPGIREADREHVFERFARGEAATQGGSGLGLAVVRQQARLHGGDAIVGESPAGGARFEVRLAAAPV